MFIRERSFFCIQMALCLIRFTPARLFAPTRRRKPVTPAIRTFRSSAGRISAEEDSAGCGKTLKEGCFASEMEVKKSRFIGCAKHVKTWTQAQTFIDEIKAEHPKARHWCYGFRSGANPVNERCSDDGEPTGTAGAPILGAIRGEDLSDTVCVVVRYFGGIKLGAGGLIRSYGAAARQVLRESPVEILIPMSSTRVKLDSSHVGSLYELLGKYSASTSEEDYLLDGSVEMTITCETGDMHDFCTSLKDATRGEAVFDREAKSTDA